MVFICGIIIITNNVTKSAKERKKKPMDKLWIVLLFLGVFLIGSSFAKKLMIRFINSAENQSAVSVIVSEKEDPRVFWNEEGKRREPEQAEFEIPDEDFFGNEKTEFFEKFEDEFSSLSDDEIEKVLREAEIFEEEGESR